jgi:hypothetical protein
LNKRKFPLYIEECLVRLDRGENLPEVLEDYPEISEQLKPILLIAMLSRSLPVPVPGQTAQRLGKIPMLEEMDLRARQGKIRSTHRIPIPSRIAGNLISILRRSGYTRLAPSYRLAMIVTVLFMSGGFLTLSASASSQPGDILYPLRMNLARVRGSLQLPQPTEFDMQTGEYDEDQIAGNRSDPAGHLVFVSPVPVINSMPGGGNQEKNPPAENFDNEGDPAETHLVLPDDDLDLSNDPPVNSDSALDDHQPPGQDKDRDKDKDIGKAKGKTKFDGLKDKNDKKDKKE